MIVNAVSGVVLLAIGAGLFLRSLDASRQLDAGFGEAPTAMVTSSSAMVSSIHQSPPQPGGSP